MRRYKKDQLRKIGLYFILDSKKRTKYLIKHNVFAGIGKISFFNQKNTSRPKLVKISVT